jgi:hypothetical protein
MAHSLITTFAYGLTAGNTASSPLQLAQERGCVDAQGTLTREGQSLSKALSRQAGMISDFRIR